MSTHDASSIPPFRTKQAIVEDYDVKIPIYSELGQICKPEAIFASNTSSLSITKLGTASGRPDRMSGVHFFNPVQLMKLVEVIKTDDTSEETDAAVKVWPGLAFCPSFCAQCAHYSSDLGSFAFRLFAW